MKFIIALSLLISSIAFARVRETPDSKTLATVCVGKVAISKNKETTAVTCSKGVVRPDPSKFARPNKSNL